MNLRPATREEYAAFVLTIPDHPRRVEEFRRPPSIYYTEQRVYDHNGRFVAWHAPDGQHWIDQEPAKAGKP